jgi:peptidoglycan-associated lipoprotein
MNRLNCLVLFVVLLALSLPGVGCRRGGKGLTPLPESRGTRLGGDQNPIRPGNPRNPVIDTIPTNTGTDELPPPFATDKPRDRETLAPYTVYFDFDSHVVRQSEQSKLRDVAAYLQRYPNVALEIEGHADERGTDEYNRSLSERRAQAIREILVASGIASNRIQTLPMGEDNPADPGHNEAAWAKNRRGEFLLIRP